MTREEAIGHIKDVICENNTIKPNIVVFEQEKEALYMAIKALEQEPKTDTWSIKDVAYTLSKHGLIAEQEPCEDAVSRQAVNEIINDIRDCISVEGYWAILERMKKLQPVNPQKPKTGHYEYHIDHTDCIWYGSDSGCPVTCSQYRDGWNDAMDYIFKNGKGYKPYRRDG